MPESRPLAAVNARYATRPVTGVERYAGELASRLSDLLGPCPHLQPARALDGPRGHAWEQLVLPRLFARSRADVLVSLCNVGPVAVARQVVVVHDAAHFRIPRSFSPLYVAQVSAVQLALARRCTVATVSETSRRELAAVLRLDAGDIALVPPAVGPPFTSNLGTAAEGSTSPYCLLVGGHDERKNLSFLLDLWPQVHRETGLELHVVGRASTVTLRGAGSVAAPGVVQHTDPDDDALAALYRSALCVLSPSRYEGFGLPLLEGMSCGTPFLATDTGAARELAVDAGAQLLPLDPRAWTARLTDWAGRDLSALRRASRARAQRWSWDTSVQALAACVRAVAARG